MVFDRGLRIPIDGYDLDRAFCNSFFDCHPFDLVLGGQLLCHDLAEVDAALDSWGGVDGAWRYRVVSRDDYVWPYDDRSQRCICSSNPYSTHVPDPVENNGRSEACPVNMSSSTLSNQFINREGEAPAEPGRRQLGRSLALPLFFHRLGIAKMSTEVKRKSWFGFVWRWSKRAFGLLITSIVCFAATAWILGNIQNPKTPI